MFCNKVLWKVALVLDSVPKFSKITKVDIVVYRNLIYWNLDNQRFWNFYSSKRQHRKVFLVSHILTSTSLSCFFLFKVKTPFIQKSIDCFLYNQLTVFDRMGLFAIYGHIFVALIILWLIDLFPMNPWQIWQIQCCEQNNIFMQIFGCQPSSSKNSML